MNCNSLRARRFALTSTSALLERIQDLADLGEQRVELDRAQVAQIRRDDQTRAHPRGRASRRRYELRPFTALQRARSLSNRGKEGDRLSPHVVAQADVAKEPTSTGYSLDRTYQRAGLRP